MKFEELVKTAMGYEPYPYQVKLATGEELPELLNIPTGVGKTAAVVLAWNLNRVPPIYREYDSMDNFSAFGNPRHLRRNGKVPMDAAGYHRSSSFPVKNCQTVWTLAVQGLFLDGLESDKLRDITNAILRNTNDS